MAKGFILTSGIILLGIGIFIILWILLGFGPRLWDEIQSYPCCYTAASFLMPDFALSIGVAAAGVFLLIEGIRAA